MSVSDHNCLRLTITMVQFQGFSPLKLLQKFRDNVDGDHLCPALVLSITQCIAMVIHPLSHIGAPLVAIASHCSL